MGCTKPEKRTMDDSPGMQKSKRRRTAEGLPRDASSWHPVSLLHCMPFEPVFTDTTPPGSVTPLDPWYTMRVEIRDGQAFTGEGRSKKLARYNAAREACTQLFGVVFDEQGQEAYQVQAMPKKTRTLEDLPQNAARWHPTTLLNYMRPQPVFRDVTPQVISTFRNMPWFAVEVEVDGQIFTGEARDKKSARANAAFEACTKVFGVDFNEQEPLEDEKEIDQVKIKLE